MTIHSAPSSARLLAILALVVAASLPSVAGTDGKPANNDASSSSRAVDDPGDKEASAADREKKAFDAAKELDTVQGWKAFLAKHPKGFYADLARVYESLLEVRPDISPGTADQGDDAASGEAVPATAKTVARVRYEGGEFVKARGKVWLEQRTGKPALRFVETSRTETAVLLYDAARKVTVTLDIENKAVLLAVGRRAPEKVYDITAALAASPAGAASGRSATGAPADAVGQHGSPGGRECADGYSFFKGRCRKLAGAAVAVDDDPAGSAAGTAKARGGKALPGSETPACRKWLTKCGQRDYTACKKFDVNCRGT